MYMYMDASTYTHVHDMYILYMSCIFTCTMYTTCTCYVYVHVHDMYMSCIFTCTSHVCALIK